jgi:hypothetical protein
MQITCRIVTSIVLLFCSCSCAKTVYTVVRSEPPDASLEVAVPGSGWTPVGQTPKSVRFTAPYNAEQQALIRLSKPGYYNEEKSFHFDTLPPEIELHLRKVK